MPNKVLAFQWKMPVCSLWPESPGSLGDVRDIFQIIQCASLPPRNGSSGVCPLDKHLSTCRTSGFLVDPAFYE